MAKQKDPDDESRRGLPFLATASWEPFTAKAVNGYVSCHCPLQVGAQFRCAQFRRAQFRRAVRVFPETASARYDRIVALVGSLGCGRATEIACGTRSATVRLRLRGSASLSVRDANAAEPQRRRTAKTQNRKDAELIIFVIG